jgi:type I restriction enzyme, S subunit
VSYPRYPELKESGVEWLGEIPRHWEIKRMRFVCKINPSKAEVSGWPEAYQVSFLPMEKVGTEGEIDLDEARSIGDVLQGFTYFRDNDVIVAKITPCFENGKGALCRNLTNRIGFGSTEFHVLRSPLGHDPKFIYYLTKSKLFRSLGEALMIGSAGQKRVPEDFIRNFVTGFPPLKEQQAIAAFLDRKTAELDQLIRLKERQIVLLNTKRQALISHTVTRGLDPSVKLRPSGIDWLGEIPAHWGNTRLKYISVSLQTGPFGSQLHSSDYIDDGIPVINPANIQSGWIVPNWSCTVDEETFNRLSHHVLIEGDIVIGRRGEMGRCGLVTKQEQNWLCGTGSLRIRLNSEYCWPQYVILLLSLEMVGTWLSLESVGSTMENLNTEILANIPIGLPPPEEQKDIVDYLQSEMPRIEEAVFAIRMQIAELREYRQALISAAVIGKIDVRGESV